MPERRVTIDWGLGLSRPIRIRHFVPAIYGLTLCDPLGLLLYLGVPLYIQLFAYGSHLGE
jgi:hypothetical protein